MKSPALDPKQLLPSSSSLLLPPSQPLAAGSGASDKLNDADVQHLAATVANFAATHAPTARKMMDQAKGQIGDLSGKAWSKATEAAAMSQQVIGDQDLRKAVWARSRKMAGVAGIAVLILAGGGWFYAQHHATEVAKERVDGALARFGLVRAITYENISASPFGSVTLDGIKISSPMTGNVQIGSLTLSRYDVQEDQFKGIEGSIKKIDLPVLAMARAGSGNYRLQELVGLGYKSVSLDTKFAADFDAETQAWTIASSGSAEDLGGWSIDLTLEPTSVAASSFDLFQSNPMTAGFGMLGAFRGIGISKASITLDNSGYAERSAEIPSDSMPPSEGGSGVNYAFLLKARGFPPEQAEQAHKALQEWQTKGGKLRLDANPDRPVSLAGGLISFAPDVNPLVNYIYQTNSKVTR